MVRLSACDWEISNIDTVLFDKDGTFIDLHFFWGKMTELRAEAVIKKYNLSRDLFDKLCSFLGYDRNSGVMLKDGITAMYSRPIIIELFCKALKNLGVDASEKEIETVFDEVNGVFYQEMTKYTKPIESAITFIKKVRALGLKTAIVTSDSKESTMLTLKHFGWESMFDVVIGRESTKETKESGVPVKYALMLLGSKPENSVMIGDAPMDYLAAKNAGVDKTILVSTGQIDVSTLMQTSDFCVESLAEVVIK